MKKLSFLLTIGLLLSFATWAQTYTPGETYFGSNDYIEYKAGNLPIIISAPHGGSIEPSNIPDRNCSGCVYVKDAYTEELIRQIYDAIVAEFGCYPHIVINRLHRRKLDANRSIGDAADGNTTAQQAWTDFHNFIETAQADITENYGKGLYIDLHGHGHSIQRLELGYRITKSELQLSNSTLDQNVYVEDASIRNLTNNNLNNLGLSLLIRGEDSFGELYEQESFPAVPSLTQPYPEDGESYFRGGYNTQRHGSQEGGSIDGIQVECNREGVRDSHNHRAVFAAATARTIKSYLEKHYFGAGFLDNDCALITATQDKDKSNVLLVNVFPNPVGDVLNVNLNSASQKASSVSIINELGQTVYSNYFDTDFIQIPTSFLSKGIYFLILKNDTLMEVRKVLK